MDRVLTIEFPECEHHKIHGVIGSVAENRPKTNKKMLKENSTYVPAEITGLSENTPPRCLSMRG